MPDDNQDFGAPMGSTAWGTSGPAEAPVQVQQSSGRAMGKTAWGKGVEGTTAVIQSRYGLRFTIRQSPAIPRT